MFNRVMFALMIGMAMAVNAGQVTLTCTGPTTRTDGDALPAAEIAGYRFFMTTASGSTTLNSTLSSTCSYAYPVPKGTCLDPATGFAATAVDTDGQSSALSSIVLLGSKVCTPKAPPAAPTAAKATAG